MKLFESELRVMEVLWSEGELPARQVAERLAENAGWNVNTTYTVIKKCVAKGAVERLEPNFRCRALLSREQVQRDEAERLVDRLFGGAPEQLFAALLGGKKLSSEQADRLRELVAEAEDGR